VKREKKAERKKQAEKEKEEERAKREEEAKEEQALEGKSVGGKGSGDSKTVFYWLLALFLLMGCLQYQRALYVRLSKFRLSPDADHYQTLEISSGASDGDLKAQYRKLVLKYHPDKNPNCRTCPEKFQEVMTAWEVLGDPEKRKHYDQNSGFIQQLPSHSLTLTPDNCEYLIGDSDVLYVVQVYDSTDRASHYFAAFWEEILPKYKGLVEFARIDVWQQS
jgi:preprotein translocase subunit Sec63